MSAALINSILHGATPLPAVTKGPIVDRTHYSGSSSGGGTYHHHQPSYGGGGHKSGKHSIALSALTLLAFLFFLNILQNCIQDHMNSMKPQVIVMQAQIKAGREAEKRDAIANDTIAPQTKGLGENPERAPQKPTETDKTYVKIGNKIN